MAFCELPRDLRFSGFRSWNGAGRSRGVGIIGTWVFSTVLCQVQSSIREGWTAGSSTSDNEGVAAA